MSERRLSSAYKPSVRQGGDSPVVLILGGMGVRPTDWVPEATSEVIDKEIPGMAEPMRTESLKKVRMAMLS